MLNGGPSPFVLDCTAYHSPIVKKKPTYLWNSFWDMTNCQFPLHHSNSKSIMRIVVFLLCWMCVSYLWTLYWLVNIIASYRWFCYKLKISYTCSFLVRWFRMGNTLWHHKFICLNSVTAKYSDAFDQLAISIFTLQLRLLCIRSVCYLNIHCQYFFVWSKSNSSSMLTKTESIFHFEGKYLSFIHEKILVLLKLLFMTSVKVFVLELNC